MGQCESTLPTRRVDLRYARIALEELYQEEFLTKQLRRHETLTQARRRPRPRARLFVDGTTRRARVLWTQLRSRALTVMTDESKHDETDENEADAVVQALVVLADLSPSTRMAYLLSHLHTELATTCHVVDATAEMIALRREILRDVVEAVAVHHHHGRLAAAAFHTTIDMIQNAVTRPIVNVDDTRRWDGNLGNAEAAFASDLVIEILGELISTDSGDVVKRDMFHEMTTLIETLTPLSLCESTPSINGEVRRIVQKVQQFLLTIALGKSGNMTSRATSADFDMVDRTNAVNCLVRLAAANGSVGNLLVVVCVLLGITSDQNDAVSNVTESPVVPLTTSPRAFRLTHVSTSPIAKSPTRELVQLKEYESDHVVDDERGDMPDEQANFAVEQRLKQVHKQRADQAIKDFDGQTTAVDQLLSSHNKRKTGPKNLIVAHTKAAVTNAVVGGASAVVANLPSYRASVPHPPTLASKINSKMTKDDLNNLSLEADLTYSLDVTSSRTEMPSPPSPRHAVAPVATIIGPKFHPLDVGSVLKEMDQIKPATSNRQQSSHSVVGPSTDPLGHHDTCEGDEDHEVWSCGQNSYGELGHGDTNTRKSFERVEALQQRDIVYVSAGNEHTVALSAEGTVWTCGYNDNGQCGQGVTTRINHLTEVQKLCDSAVTHVHAYNGCEHTIFVMEDGKAASCGYNYRGQLGHGNTQSESVPKILRSLEGKQVRLVSCSYYHTVITCDSGSLGKSMVYTFGRNDYGQLGHGDSIDRKVPQCVEAIQDHHIISIACGQYHTMAVTSTGKLFAFGKNDYGQLGIDTVENQLLPVHVKAGLERQTCVEVRCGYYHSIVLCAGAHLFGFGRNDYGQLGIGKASNAAPVNMQLQQQRFARPQLLDDLEGKEIVRFACGCYHTVTVSDNGVLYVFGRNNHGQLGTGDTNERLYPYPIDDFVGKRVALVAAGFYHTLVLTGGSDEDVEDNQSRGDTSGSLDNHAINGYTTREDLEVAAITHLTILKSPCTNELFDAKISRVDTNKVVASAVIQPPVSGVASDREQPDPSYEGEHEDGRLEDRRSVSIGDINRITEVTAMNTRQAVRYTEGESVGGTLSSPGKTHHAVRDSIDVAVIILAQLDRLSSSFLMKKPAVYPVTQHLSVSVVERLLRPTENHDLFDVVHGVFEPFAIEVHSTTFARLSSLIVQLNCRKVDALNASNIAMYFSPRVSNAGVKLQAYLLSVCFKILHANLVQIVKSGLISILTALQQLNPRLHQGNSDQQQMSSTLCELVNLQESLHQVRTVVLEVITKSKLQSRSSGIGSTDTEQSAANRPVSDAIETLMVGFDIFFPCQCSRVALVESLVGSTLKGDDSTCEMCRSLELVPLRALKPIKKRQLLIPLLKRLSDDATTMRFLPLDDTSTCLPPSLKVKPFEALDTIIEVLLDYMNRDFVRSIGSITASSVPREDDTSNSLSRSDPLPHDAIVTFLNAATKHLITIARGCERWPRRLSLDSSSSLSSRLSLITRAVLKIGAFPGDTMDEQTEADFPVAWRGFLRLALSVLAQSNDILVQMLSRSQPSPSSSGQVNRSRKSMFVDAEFCDRLAIALERSVVGRVLPLLVNSVFAFTQISAFAVTLIHPLQAVMNLLDEWNITNPAVCRAAEDELKHRVGKSLTSSDPASAITTRQRLGTRQVSSSASPSIRGDAVINTNTLTVSEVISSPWSLTLEKELAMLCAEMASTITHGEPLVHLMLDDPTPKDTKSVLTKWRNSSLFDGGLSTSFVHCSVIGSKLERTILHSPISLFDQSFTDTSHFQLILPPREQTMDACEALVEDPVMRSLQYLRMSNVRAFIAEMAYCSETANPELRLASQRLCEWLRLWHARNDAAYRMLMRQSLHQKQAQSDPSACRTSTNTVSDMQLEEMFFAALLHYHALESFALLVARTQHSEHCIPPRTLLGLWRVVAEIRRRFVAKRTVLKNTLPPEEASEAITRLQRAVRDRSQLLLLVEVEDEEEHRLRLLDSGFVAPWDPAFVFRACAKTDSVVSGLSKRVSSHMSTRYGENELPFLMMFPTSRWRRVRTFVHVMIRWKALVTASRTISSSNLTTAALEFVSADEKDVGDVIEIAYELLIEPCRRLSCSTRGYELMGMLIRTPKLECVRISLIQHLGQASAQLPSVHSRRGASLSFREMWQWAQNDFMTVIAQLMVAKASDIALLPSDDPSHIASQWALFTLLRCLSLVHFTEDQYEFINDLGLIPVLQHMLQEGDPDDVTEKGVRRDDSIRALLPKATSTSQEAQSDKPSIQVVVWTLLRSLVLHFGASSSTGSRTLVPVYPVCYEVFETLYADANRYLQRLSRDKQTSELSLLERARNVGGSINNSIRRSFELIVAPKRLSFLSKGMVFTYREMIEPASGLLAMSPLVKPNEFSITTWIYAAASPTEVVQSPGTGGSEEKQIVFVRGDEREISPYVLLLRDLENKWQLEVGIAVHITHPSSLTPTRLLWERLNSKESLIRGRWTHVAIVLEGAKLRLYLNGILDSQRSLSGALATALSSGSVDLDFSFGRPQPVFPSDGSHTDETVSCHSPCAAKAMSFVTSLVSTSPSTAVANMTPAPQPIVRSLNGLLSHFRFHNRALSPIHVRIVFDEKKPVRNDGLVPTVSELRLSDEATKLQQMHSVLRVMIDSDEGRVHLANPCWSSQLWEIVMCCRHSPSQLSSLRLLRLVLRFQPPQIISEEIAHRLPLLPPNYRFVQHVLQLIGTCVSPTSNPTFAVPATVRNNGQSDRANNETVPIELRDATAEQLLQETARGSVAMALANELTGLLVSLLQQTENPAWPLEIWSVIGQGLRGLHDPDDWFTHIGCLYVLGGGASVLTSGVDVELMGTSERATIVALEDAFPKTSQHPRQSDMAFVAIHRPIEITQDPSRWDDRVHNACVAYAQNVAPLKATLSILAHEQTDSAPFIRVHKDDLVTPPAMKLVGFGNFTSDDMTDTVVQHLSQAVSDLTIDNFTITDGLAELRRWLGASLVVHAVERVASDCSRWFSLLGEHALLTKLLEISAQDDGNPQFSTLEEVEQKLWIVRTRVYQVLHDLDEQGVLEVQHWFAHTRVKANMEGIRSQRSDMDTSRRAGEDEDDADETSGVPRFDLRLNLAVDDPAIDQGNLESQQSADSSTEKIIDQSSRESPDDEGKDNIVDDDEEATGGDGEDDDDDEEEEEEDGGDDDDEDEDEAAEHRQEFVDELMMMGFPEEWCVLALKQTENDIVSASAWIVDNLEYLSRLQTSLDKQRDQSTDKLVMEDEDDDGDEGGAEVDGIVEDESPESPNVVHHNRTSSHQGNGMRTHSHSPTRPDGSQHLVNEKEMGRKIFGEMYFPFEDGGFESSAKDRFFTEWRLETAQVAATVSSSAPSATESTEDIQSTQAHDQAKRKSDSVDELITKIDTLELSELLDHLARLERAFLIMSSRRVLLILLNQHAEIVMDMVESSSFVSFMRLVLCRGTQFHVQQCGSDGTEETTEVVKVVRLSLDLVLRKERSTTFALRLLDYALDQVDAAANAAFETVLWTQRDRRRSDRVVLDEPAVELAAWLFDVVLSCTDDGINMSPPQVEHILDRLRPALRSTNLPVKFIALTTMSRVLRQVHDRQHRTKDDSFHSILETCRLDVESFLSAAKNRFLREQVQHRAVFSLYLQAYVEILFLLQRISAAGSFVNPLPPPIPTSCLPSLPIQLDDPTKSTIHHPMLMFDRLKCRSSLLQIADDGLTATYTGNELWKTVLTTQSFATGVHEWHLRIEKSSSSYLFIGVANRQVTLDSFLGADDHSWGFIGDKAVYYQRNRLRVYGDSFGEGDIVGVHLNCELGTLGFSKNGTFLGVAFENLLDEVFPAVAFYSRHQKVSIIHSDTASSEEKREGPTSYSTVPNGGTVEEAVLVCEMMDRMVTRSPLPSPVLQLAYNMTMMWWHGTGRHVVTRSGASLWVDITSAACHRFGFFANDAVRSPRGNGRVLGVADNRLWIEVDGESGAWHIHPSRLRTMTLSVAGHSVSTSVVSLTSAKELTVACEANESVASVPQGVDLTLADFTALVQDRIWSLHLDRAVLNVINDHCESESLSRWNIAPHDLVRLVQSKANDIELAAGTTFSFESRDGGHRLERLVLARYGFLRFFNAYVSRVIGFFDSTWRYFAPTSSSTLLPCRLMSQCRGSMFTSIKNELFTALMDKTSNSPKKSDDDYDYPEDLTQLLINRPKAATAKCHPGTTTSLLLSMVGQAFNALHFLPLRMLRMVYSHPMDDGQLRSFKVKFEGEGVDDYGGPYREFFSQFFAELQMLCAVEGADDGTLGTNFLPFLLPSPNWRNGVGANRERFVLNGGLLGSRYVGLARIVPASPLGTSSRGWAEDTEVKRQLHSEMCHFLGQMLGIALRTRVCVRLDLAASVWKQLVGEEQDLESVLADLKETDFVAHTLLKTLKGLHETMLNPSTTRVQHQEIQEQVEAMDLTFTTYLSDGRFVELCEKGSEIAVTTTNLAQYINLVLRARMDEATDVVNVIKQGIHTVIPVAALSLLTWQELEKRICGVAEVDVELLKRNTEYDEDLSAQDESVQRFWRVLSAFEDEDKRAFLRFVWARSRLPVGAAQFHQKFKIQSLAPSAEGTNGSTSNLHVDTQLPKSHTCFFALQLPRYSTDAICRQQLLYAVHNCVEMDGDFRLADAEMTGWTDVDPHDQLRF